MLPGRSFIVPVTNGREEEACNLWCETKRGELAGASFLLVNCLSGAREIFSRNKFFFSELDLVEM